MNAFSNFLDATTIFINSLTYFQDSSTPLIDSGDKSRSSICVPKKKGALEFTLNAKDHFGKNDFNFDIHFQGTQLGNDAAGNPRIRWSMSPDFAKNKNSNVFTLSKSGIDVAINEVSGSVITVLTDLNPIITTVDCQGSNATSKVAMDTVSGENNFIEVAGEGLGIGVTIGFRNIGLACDCRVPANINSSIKALENECGIGGVAPGGLAKFAAFVTGTDAGDTISYSWAVSGGFSIVTKSGATPKGPTNTYLFQVQLGSNTKPITVTVTITVTDPSGTVKYNKVEQLTYQPDTEQTVKFKTLLCRVKSYVRPNFFINPLLDPLRDLSVKPVTKKELTKLQNATKVLLKDLISLSKFKGL